jgi:hypothetical protein
MSYRQADTVTKRNANQLAHPNRRLAEPDRPKSGYAVVVARIRQSAIFGKCRERGSGPCPNPRFGALSRPDVAEELANETVAKALNAFRNTC